MARAPFSTVQPDFQYSFNDERQCVWFLAKLSLQVALRATRVQLYLMDESYGTEGSHQEERLDELHSSNRFYCC